LQNIEYAQELRKIIQAIGDTPTNTYYPSDDSYLMLDALARLPLQEKKVLDVGTGSGVLALFCATHGAQVTATDIDRSSLRHADKASGILGLSLELIVSDLFSKVKGQFDLVLFNPPYLPSSALEDSAVDGGPGGAMLSRRFLEELPIHLKRAGTALLLVSSLNEPASWVERYPEFQFSVMAKRSLFFEELRVLGVRFREDLAR
jgi:release factor glutamine methyltransferase